MHHSTLGPSIHTLPITKSVVTTTLNYRDRVNDSVLSSVGVWITVIVWSSWDRVSLMYSFKYNPQDAKLYNILYYYQCSTWFGRFLRPSSGAQNCTHSSVGELFQLTHASGSSKQAWHIPGAVCTVLSSWWWAEKPTKTCRALTVIKNTV
jgi:hypothetical protein